MRHTVTIGVPYKDDYVDVTVSFKYYYDAGKDYMRNGDPGYPAEEALGIIQVHNEIPKYITDEMIIEALYEIVDDVKDEDL
jgi:hypothetical protein